MGKEVSIDQANACIQRHRTQPNTTIATDSVSFTGPDLMEWMNKTAAKMRSAGRQNFGFKMILGQLTREYLNATGATPEQTAALSGRTTIFIVPYSTETSGLERLSATSEGFTAYDYGGLEP